jgi:E3 ubiquitin-protein ligase EDD1
MSGAGTTGGGFIYMDHASSLRRGAAGGVVTANVGSSAVAAAAAAAAAANMGANGADLTSVTMTTTTSGLARAYGIVVRQIADLLAMLTDYAGLAPSLDRLLDVSYAESVSLQLLIELRLKPNWDWLMSVMDSTEGQLRFGSALTHSSDPTHPAHPLHASGSGRAAASAVANVGGRPTAERTTFTTRSGMSVISSSSSLLGDANRRDFMGYALSLLRAHSSEHADTLPVIDVSGRYPNY